MPRQKRAWSEKESTMLRVNVKNYSIPEIAEMMGREISLIYKKVNELGLRDIVKRGRRRVKKLIRPKDTKLCKWREHPVADGYYVSDTGRVWSAMSGRELTRVINNGRYVVTLMKDGKESSESIGRIVVDTWLRPKKEYMIYYRDKNPLNNDLANLIPASVSAVRQLIKTRPVMLVRNNKIIKVYASIRIAAKELNIKYGTLLLQLRGKVKRTHHGLDLRYYVKPKREEDES